MRFSSRASCPVPATRISIFSIANSLPKLGSFVADRYNVDLITLTKRVPAVKVEVVFAGKRRRLGRFVSDVFLLDKTETTDKVRLNCPNFNKSPGAEAMKNVYEVLRQKELELSRLEKEVEALRVAAPLLSEDKEVGNDNKPTLAATATQTPIRIPQPAVNSAPQAARAAGWEDTAKRWP